MFEWLKERHVFLKDGNEGIVTGFNKMTDKLIIKLDNGKKEEIDLFGSGIYYDVSFFENYQKRLYDKFLKENELAFQMMSTQSNDVWDFRILRKEIEVLDNLDYPNKVVNYIIVFAGSIEHITALTTNDESLNQFSEWFERVSESYEIFNYWDATYNNIDGITFERSFVTDKEWNLLWEMLDEFSFSKD